MNESKAKKERERDRTKEKDREEQLYSEYTMKTRQDFLGTLNNNGGGKMYTEKEKTSKLREKRSK